MVGGAASGLFNAAISGGNFLKEGLIGAAKGLLGGFRNGGLNSVRHNTMPEPEYPGLDFSFNSDFGGNSYDTIYDLTIGPKNPNNPQNRITNAIKELKKSEIYQTPEGKVVIDLLEKKNRMGLISWDKEFKIENGENPFGNANYNWKTGEIRLNSKFNFTDEQLPGLLGHEGMHAAQYEIVKFKGSHKAFWLEREAYDFQYKIDKVFCKNPICRDDPWIIKEYSYTSIGDRITYDPAFQESYDYVKSGKGLYMTLAMYLAGGAK